MCAPLLGKQRGVERRMAGPLSPASSHPPAAVSSSCDRSAAKLRRKALAKIQKSTARKLRLGRHEAGMAEALLQVGGSCRQLKQNLLLMRLWIKR